MRLRTGRKLFIILDVSSVRIVSTATRAREPIDQALELEQGLFRPIAADAEVGDANAEHALERGRIGVLIGYIRPLGVGIAATRTTASSGAR